MRKYGLCIIWVLATASSFVGLYFSEIARIPPCPIDWFERICLYPLMIMAGIAAWHNFYKIASYLLPQTLIGLGLSIYKLLLLETSWFPPLPNCPIDRKVAYLSFLTFLAINALLIPIRRISKKGLHENR